MDPFDRKGRILDAAIEPLNEVADKAPVDELK